MTFRRDRGTRLILAVAVLLLLGGLATAGTAARTWWWRARETGGAQQRLSQSLDERWAARGSDLPEAAGRGPAAMPFGGARGTTDPGDGTPLARLHLPTLGLDLVVVDGADDADLRLGPGYIPGTAPIGAAGNTGIAGHRQPGVFWSLDRLGIGAPVVLETRDTWFVYRVIEAKVVRPEAREVLDPPPPGASPLLTLVTCEPRLTTARRLIRQATLVRRDPHGGPRPAELA
ncbi:sortase [Dactylosporangium sp. NPDC000555]|uniref:sortase n=1 Tax=Dactylosporangium sp. NPDC000555 TaxID=3154260 RepID=UPI00331B78CD